MIHKTISAPKNGQIPIGTAIMFIDIAKTKLFVEFNCNPLK